MWYKHGAPGGTPNRPPPWRFPCISGSVRYPLLVLDHFNHDARDVIAGAGVKGHLTQTVSTLLNVGLFLDEVQHLLVGDDAAEAVGAEQEPVAALQLHDLHFGA